MVLLMDYHAANQDDEAIKEALTQAQLPHQHLRSNQLLYELDEALALLINRTSVFSASAFKPSAFC